MKVKEQIKRLLSALNEGLFEKEETMALALLSAIAGESIFLLGAPGVAKSLIARRLKFAFKDGKAFEYLMNRFSTPDEIFGPVSIKALKEDKYERITEDYLPGATVVFLDEIWKAGPSIQNALLTVLNEKVYRNGAQEVKVPMKALISASNELPAKGEGLEALWDRFMVRLVVGGISEKDSFNSMITIQSNAYEDNIPDSIKITDKQYKEWSKAIDEISVPENVLNVIQVIRASIQEHNQNENKNGENLYVSDRRWRKMIRLMRTSAFLNDRTEVDLMDCFLIMHCIWDEMEQAEIVGGMVRNAIEKHGVNLPLDLNELRQTVIELREEVSRETKKEKEVMVEVPEIIFDEFYFVLGINHSLIKKADFELLTTESRPVTMYPYDANEYNRRNRAQTYNIFKHGASPNHIVHNGTPYQLKVHREPGTTILSCRPNPKLQKVWDEEVLELLVNTEMLRNTIQVFRNEDLASLRDNAFVNSSETKYVETNLTSSLSEIENIELGIKQIKHHYETIKDGSKVKKL